MLTRNSRRALSEKIDNEGSPAKRRRVDLGSNMTVVKREMSQSTDNKRKVKASQNLENCNPGPSTSRARILPRHSRQALSERSNNKVSQEKKHKVDRTSKKKVLKKEISESLGNEINIKTSPPKRRKVNRVCKKIEVKNETSEHLDNTVNIKISSTNRVNKSAQKNVDVNKENLPQNLSRVASEKLGVKNEISVPSSKEINQEYSHNVENFIPGPSTSKAKLTKRNTDVKEENLAISAETEDNCIFNEASLNKEAIPNNDESIVELDVPLKVLEEVLLSTDDEDEQIEARKVTTHLDNSVGINLIEPLSSETEKNNHSGNEALLNQGEAIADNDESIVELEVPQKVFEEVLLFSDNEDDQIEARKTVTTSMDNSVGINFIVPHSSETEQNNHSGNEPLLNQGEAIADKNDSIVELEVPKKVFEEVLLFSDDEDDQIEARKTVTTSMDNSVNLPSGSSGNTSQTRTSASCKSNIEIIKIEDPSPQSAVTPKKKKLVLDPSVLTPPTGDLRENTAKLWKCMQFLEQSDLNPEAKDFVPSPKVSKKVVEEPKPTDCIVCLEPRETTFVNIPCRHAVTCGPCSDQLELLGNDCPVCRTPIETRFQIYN